MTSNEAQAGTPIPRQREGRPHCWECAKILWPPETPPRRYCDETCKLAYAERVRPPRCRLCGKPLPPSKTKPRLFCDNGGVCRHAYDEGIRGPRDDRGHAYDENGSPVPVGKLRDAHGDLMGTPDAPAEIESYADGIVPLETPVGDDGATLATFLSDASRMDTGRTVEDDCLEYMETRLDAYIETCAWPKRVSVAKRMTDVLREVLASPDPTIVMLSDRLTRLEAEIAPKHRRPVGGRMTDAAWAAVPATPDADLPIEYLVAAFRIARALENPTVPDAPNAYDRAIAQARVETMPRTLRGEVWREAPSPEAVQRDKRQRPMLRAMANVSKSHSPEEAAIAARKLDERKP